jgi:multidrug resistance efflux pump
MPFISNVSNNVSEDTANLRAPLAKLGYACYIVGKLPANSRWTSFDAGLYLSGESRGAIRAMEEHDHNESAQQDSHDNNAAQDIQESKSDPVRKYTLIVIGIIIILFLWSVLADRYAPWTDQARVQTWIVPISPKVSGKVKEVNVVKDQVVEAGHLLVKIDDREFQLAVQKAEADLEMAGQSIGASTEQVAIAEAALAQAQTELSYVAAQAKRYLTLAETGTISRSEAERVKAEADNAGGRVTVAQAELEKAKDQLGAKGQENPRIRAAIAALGKARLDLGETELYAPLNGGITNLKVAQGYYAKAGVPIMTFVAFGAEWIQADMRENSIGNVKLGDSVDIVLDMAPGKVFKGTVGAKGFAVKAPSYGAAGDVVTIKGSSGWLRDAQRFPVIINFADNSAEGLRMVGGQADVQIYTGENIIIDGLGWLWIRLLSLLSYVY